MPTELWKVQPAVERADERTIDASGDQLAEVRIDHSHHVVVQNSSVCAEILRSYRVQPHTAQPSPNGRIGPRLVDDDC
jgi:hypothetical protein